jgi:dihydrofolate reductase
VCHAKARTVDGGIARWAGRPAGALRGGGWGLPPEDPALRERKLGWMQDVGLHLMGRNTYEEMAGFWPTSVDAYAAPMNEIPKVVFSSTLELVDWPDSRIARGDLAEEISELKREPGKDMLAWGGAAFAQSLSRLGLVDEYRLILQPGGARGRASPVQGPHGAAAARAHRRADLPHWRNASRLPPRARGLLTRGSTFDSRGAIPVRASREVLR